MVWFQCEDCGENLKKPKLPNHFRMCSAGKLSCIDCGEMFSQETVQGHTQCITEAEKYGPKGEGKPSHGTQLKPEKPKKNADVDIHVGLSSRPPWFCSLCNAQATSRQTLMGHADGKKHRAKARAHHASQNQTSQTDEQTQNRDSPSEVSDKNANVSNDSNGMKSDNKISTKDSSSPLGTENGSIASKKRKIDAPTDDGIKGEDVHAEFITNGEVIQADPSIGSHKSSKRSKSVDGVLKDGHAVDKHVHTEENTKKKIKWKKLVTSVLKSKSDGALKLKKLQKLVIQSFQESGVTEDEDKLLEKLLAKVSSSSRFVVDGKHIRLAAKEASF